MTISPGTDVTTLYRPVLIETAEQAEALPIGTIALLPFNGSHRQVLTKTTDRSPGPWDLEMHGYANDRVIGWSALVPVEAEEEWTVGHDAPAWAPGTETWARKFQAHEPGRRLFRRATTAWEEA